MPDLQSSLDLCTFCPRLCSHTCPVSLVSARETLTPQAKMASFAELRRLADPEPSPEQTTPLYGCTGCGACTTACLHKVEPAQLLMRGRAEAQRAEGGPDLLADLPLRHRHRAREAARQVQHHPALQTRLAEAGEVALLPTCLPRRSAQPDGAQQPGPVREAQTALRIVDKLRAVKPEVPTVGLAKVSHGCAGYALYAGGYTESFRLHAELFAREIESYPTLVTSCSACTWLLRVQYAEHGVPLKTQVQHLSEWLAPHAEALPITKPMAQATYHDPCHLGRRLGCYEPPRQLLQRAVTQLDELTHHHEAATCCGSGGLLPQTDPPLASAIARERLSEQPANLPLISACPACQSHLGRNGSSQVYDLLEVLDEAMR